MTQPLAAYAIKPGTIVEQFHIGGIGRNEFCRMLLGPFGSGKTVAACWDVFMLSRQQPKQRDGKRRSRWAFVRNTKRQLQDMTISTWMEWFPDGVAGDYEKTAGRFTLTYEDLEVEILFRALDDPDDVRNLLGLELTGAFLNEAREIHKSIWEGVTGRVGRYPRMVDIADTLRWVAEPPALPGRWWRRSPDSKVRGVPDELLLIEGGSGLRPTDSGFDEVPLGEVIAGVTWAKAPWAGIIADSNPCAVGDYMYDLFEVKARQDEVVGALYHLYHQPPGVLEIGKRWRSNPKAENLENLRPGYYLNQIVGKDRQWIRVYAEGLYGIISEGQPVYQSYDDEWHVAEFRFDALLPCYVGWDFGIRGMACVIAQLSSRGQLRAMDETFADGVPLNQFVRDQVIPMLGRYKGAIWEYSAADPAGNKRSDTDESQSTAMLNDAYPGREVGLPFITYPASTNALATRIGAVGFFINSMVEKRHAEAVAPRFILHPRCALLREGFQGRYEFKRVQGTNGNLKEVPDKNRFSHVQDALQYLCLGILSTTDISGEDRDPYEDSARSIKKAVNTNRYSGY